jgi:PPK2 family polyphosphate:nucleotide phosphotransferase
MEEERLSGAGSGRADRTYSELAGGPMSSRDPWELPLGKRVRLSEHDPADTSPLPGGKAAAKKEAVKNRTRLEALQELLYAAHSRSLLIVLQALDTGGKDGVTRKVFEGMSPQGVRVAQFRVPSLVERDHDFLWRVHRETPGRGEIVIFNRSHYEDVLVARVEKLVPTEVWKERFRAINEFERTLTEEGTVILKFFLHISRDEQRTRLLERLDDPTKHWKLTVADLRERSKWPEYTRAIEDVLVRTNTAWAPWRLIPSNKKWFRDWAVASVVMRELRSLKLHWPPLAPELRKAGIPP